MKRTIYFTLLCGILYASASRAQRTEPLFNSTKTQTDITMKNQNYTTTFLVDQTPAEVFNAITNVKGWWSEEVDGGTENLNDVFLYHYQDVHLCKIKLIEVVPNEKIVWYVLDNHFNFTEDEKEWTDTQIVFEISRKGNQTQLRFTHVGLVPSYECYDICRQGWGNYIDSSLYHLITTGKGEPNPKEGGFNAQLIKEFGIDKN